MSYVIAINDNEFVHVYGHEIRSGANFEKHLEIQHIKFPVNLNEAEIYETYK